MENGKKDEIVRNNYVCPWPKCGHEFSAIAGKLKVGEGGIKKLSNSIVCPKCGNGLKTW